MVVIKHFWQFLKSFKFYYRFLKGNIICSFGYLNKLAEKVYFITKDLKKNNCRKWCFFYFFNCFNSNNSEKFIFQAKTFGMS